MEFKGTIGNWKLEVSQNENAMEYTYDVDCGSMQVATVYDPNDAKLIAAAPDLLEALQELHSFSAKQNPTVEHYDVARHSEVLKNAYKAINKALK